MKKTIIQKIKLGILSLSALGLLAACNTTDDYEQNPEQPPAVEESEDMEAETP